MFLRSIHRTPSMQCSQGSGRCAPGSWPTCALCAQENHRQRPLHFLQLVQCCTVNEQLAGLRKACSCYSFQALHQREAAINHRALSAWAHTSSCILVNPADSSSRCLCRKWTCKGKKLGKPARHTNLTTEHPLSLTFQWVIAQDVDI